MAINDSTPTLQGGTDGTIIGNDSDSLLVAAKQTGTWTVTQSGTWNIVNISGTISLPTGASTAANQTTGNTSLSSIDSKTPALGQALAAGSTPVVLTAAQLSTLTPLNTVAVTQSTSPWVTSRNWTLASGTDSVASVQSGTWNLTNITGTISLPTGAATETTVNSLLKPASTLAAVTTLGSITNTVTIKADTAANQANALKVDGSATTQPISAAALPLPAGAATSALQTSANTALSNLALTQGPVTGGTAATKSQLIGGIYSNPLAILQPGQQAALQTNYRGELLVAQSLNSPTTDAASRLRVSELNQALGYTFSLSDQSLAFNSSLTSGGTATHTPSAAVMRLATTTTNGSQSIFQTKKYLRYTVGVSHMVNLSVVVGAAKTNVRQRWGFFDSQDGLFFQQTSAALSVAVRTSTSGSVVDNVIEQSSWNLDKFDGTGPSGITLDPSKDNLYLIDFTWHGSARVRFGAMLNGVKVYCHEYIATNVFTVPYTRTAFLPIRLELTNTAATASNTSMDLIAVSAFKESSELFAPSYNFARSTGRTLKNATAVNLPFISIRPKTTFAGITNRIAIQPTGIQVVTGVNPVVVQLIVNPTLTLPIFTSVGTQSSVEYDVTATAVTGGTVVAEYFVATNGTESFTLSEFGDAILLGLDVAGTTADILTIALQSTSANTGSGAVIRWGEYQ